MVVTTKVGRNSNRYGEDEGIEQQSVLNSVAASSKKSRGSTKSRASTTRSRRTERTYVSRSTYDIEQEEHEKFIPPPDFDGPTSKRHCTDVLCTLLIIICWIAMTIVGIYSISNGDYRVVLNPLDYDGNICGTDYGPLNMTNYPYLYYINSFTGGVCLSECPNLNGIVEDNLTDVRTLITYGGLYQIDGYELNSSFIKINPYYNETSDAYYCYDDGLSTDEFVDFFALPNLTADDQLLQCYPNNNTIDSWKSNGINEGYGIAYYVVSTYTLWSRCYVTRDAEERIEELVNTTSQTLQIKGVGYDFWNDLYHDVWTSKEYILGFGFGCSVVISFFYTYLLRVPCLLNTMIWGSIFLSIGMVCGGGYYAMYIAEYWENEDPQVWSNTFIDGTRIFGYVLFGLAGLLLLIVCCLRKQIQLAIGCVKQAARAIDCMPLIILWPIVQTLGLLAFMAVLIYYGIYLVSLGNIGQWEIQIPGQATGTTITFRTYEFDDFVENCCWYLLFCWFWTANFIVAIGDMVISMSVAKWYFTRNKGIISSWYVLRSICDTLYYHVGTCAFGSLIIAIVQFIRAILTKVQRQLEKYGNKGIVKCIFCCCQCCLCCLEKILKFISKNAYIQTALFGTSFCKSSREAFFLILRNAGRVSAITYVSAAILIVGKVFIASITTILAYMLMVENLEGQLYSVAGPTIFVFLISYFVSDMFMDIFDISIIAILHCFVADEEMFLDTRDHDNVYAEGNLRNWIDKFDR